MYAEYSKFAKNKQQKGHISPFDIKGEGMIIPKDSKDEENVNHEVPKDGFFIRYAWCTLHSKSEEDLLKDKEKENLLFLEEFYAQNFRSQNIQSIESKMVSFDT